jgi:uncharacterized protein (DUF58 family)
MIPLWILLALIAALLLVAWRFQIFPHRPLIVVLTLVTLLSVWLVPLPNLWPWVAAIDAVIFFVAGVDLSTLAHPHSLTVERQVGRIASLGKSHRVTLVVSNHFTRPQPVWIRDGVPSDVVAEPDEFCVELKEQSRSTMSYTLRANRRGACVLNDVFVRVRSRWGLWQRMLREPCHSLVHVYPDMKQLEEYALLARTNRLSLMGVRRTRKVGQDNEFERLRDYTRDDNFRHIDWRATARRRKLIVKDFQANQSQRIVFLIDCGRMMTSEAAGVSLLDHALNAMLMLSFVALKRGDQVGLLCFSDHIHRFVPPAGGSGHTNRLLHAAHDQYAEMVESRYDDAFLHLASHVRKRALVVLITNVIDEVNARQIGRHLRTLTGRHLPLGVLLRDHALFDAIDRYEEEVESRTKVEGRELKVEDETTKSTLDPQLSTLNLSSLYPAAAAADILAWRHRVLADLEMSGVLSLDVFPENLAAPLVNRYIDIKARHLL